MESNKSIKALIKLNEHEDHVLNIVKAKYRLRNKNDAIRLVIKDYEKNELEPELRPEYIKKAKKIMKQKPIYVGTPENLRKMIGLG